jgi:hypothetical protein
MNDETHDKRWLDFKFTVDVILAAALTREAAAEMQAVPRPSLRSARFNLLAAAAAAEARCRPPCSRHPRSQARSDLGILTLTSASRDWDFPALWQNGLTSTDDTR